MANTNNPRGFIYEGRFSDESPPIHDYEMGVSSTLNVGDPVKFVNGYVIPANTGDIVLGVFLGAGENAAGMIDGDGGVTSGAGEHPIVKIVLALADVYFRVQDANATASISNRGTSVDFSGATGVGVVDSSASISGDVLLLDKAGMEDRNGNSYGANMDWLGIFQARALG